MLHMVKAANYSGPLCEEPMAAIAFVLEEWTGSLKCDLAEASASGLNDWYLLLKD